MTTSMRFLLSLLFISVALTGCKKEDPKPTPPNTTLPSPVTTGSLGVYVKNYINNPVKGREVWLYTSEADFNSSTYYKKATTNNNGYCEFNNLIPGVYWVDCLFNDALGNPVIAEGNASVSGGYITSITIKP